MIKTKIDGAKIWQQGVGTLIVSIPKHIAERKGLKKGDIVDLTIEKE